MPQLASVCTQKHVMKLIEQIRQQKSIATVCYERKRKRKREREKEKEKERKRERTKVVPTKKDAQRYQSCMTNWVCLSCGQMSLNDLMPSVQANAVSAAMHCGDNEYTDWNNARLSNMERVKPR